MQTLLKLSRAIDALNENVGKAAIWLVLVVTLISAVNADLCEHCGNCTRCPYLAISLNGDKVPQTDASKCIGCSICAQKCFSGALFMRERTEQETALLSEH